MTSRKLHVGFTLLEIMIVMAIIGIIAAAVIPKVADSLAQAREATALQHLRTIHTAQAAYFSKYGEFALSLDKLGPPAPKLIPADLARGEKMGYRFALESSPEGYAILARPVAPERADRSFYSDGSMVIRHAPRGQTATAESPELGSRAQ